METRRWLGGVKDLPELTQRIEIQAPPLLPQGPLVLGLADARGQDNPLSWDLPWALWVLSSLPGRCPPDARSILSPSSVSRCFLTAPVGEFAILG